MATLLLSTVGTMFGGPLGGALGSLVGQAIDQQLFGPPPRRGPRLGDLAVQTSSYGTPIPKLFGTMRVAGTVVWATDLKEEEAIQGGGKSGPEVITYAYLASFAVALSSRRAERIGRIWADGKLIRGAADDFKVPCTFRFHSGSEDQPVDPLIASIEGVDGTPSFRGLAVAVFEDLALVEFGNRIPMLTFELVADEQPVSLAAILIDVSEGVIRSETATAKVRGFAAHGSDQRSAIADLVDIWDIGMTDDGEQLRIGGTAVTAVNVADRGCAVSDGKRTAEERSQEPAKALPSSLAVTYYDPSRDFQAGQMRAVIAGGGRLQWRIDCPVVLEATEAKALANAAMARRWAERDRMTLHLSPRFSGLFPGTLIDVEGVPGRWRVEAVTIDGLVAVAELRRIVGAVGSAIGADPGRSTKERDEPIGRTALAMFDLPTGAATADGELTVSLAASTAGAFKPVPVSLSVAGQPSGSAVVTRRAVLGTALSALPSANPFVADRRNVVDIALHDAGQLLLNADRASLGREANLAVVGRELIQFGRADDLGDGRFRLSHLHRGRYGTEWAIGDHRIGEAFLLIDRAAMVPVVLNAVTRGARLEATAHGVGDDPMAPPTAFIDVSDEARRPIAPAHLSALFKSDGSLDISWVDRSRTAFAWVDSTLDPPLDGRLFEVMVSGPADSWSGTTSSRALNVPCTAVSTLGPGSLIIAVTEVSGTARSRPAILHKSH